MRVLLADDDANTRALVRRLLSRQVPELEITECTNGLEALERLSRDSFSFVLLDYAMPLMDGLDVLRSIRSTSALARLPVIMMTGVSDALTVQRIVRHGVDDYLLKPIRPNQLCERVTRLISCERRAVVYDARAAFPPLTLTGDTRVLLAEGSAEFRQFFTKMVGPLCTVETVSSGLAAFQRCLEAPPYAVFIGSDLGIITGELLARKLGQQPRLRLLRTIGVAPARNLVQTRRSGCFEKVIAQSFVPDLFLESFRSLLPGQSPASRLLTMVPDLKLIVISTAEEALGSALGLAIRVKSSPSVSRGPGRCASLLASIGDDAPPVRIRISSAARYLGSLSQRLAAGGVVATPGDDDAALAALLMRFVSRLAPVLEAHGVFMSHDEPVVANRPASRSVSQPREGLETATCEVDVTGDKTALRIELSERNGLVEEGRR